MQFEVITLREREREREKKKSREEEEEEKKNVIDSFDVRYGEHPRRLIS